MVERLTVELGGASAWGTLGIFAIFLYKAGLNPMDVAAVRVTVAWIGFATLAFVAGRRRLRLTPRQLLGVLTHGLIAVALYNLLFFEAIAQLGIALAFALLYTAPGWSIVLGQIFLRERHPLLVYLTIPLVVVGVALVVMNPTGNHLNVTIIGLISGIGAGLTYALFSVLGKPLLYNCPPSTLLFYSFGTGAVILDVLAVQDGIINRITSLSPANWTVLLATGIVSTLLAYLAYTEGLRRTSVVLATLLAALEPVVAVILGVTVTDESLSGYQFGGIFLIVAATAIVAIKQ